MYSWFNLCGLLPADAALAQRLSDLTQTTSGVARHECTTRYNGCDAEVGGCGSGRCTRDSGDRAATCAVPMKAVQQRCYTSWASPSSTFGFIAQGRIWPAQRACSCAHAVSIRCCCVRTATAGRGIAAGHAQWRAAMSAGDTPPSSTRIVGVVGSSMLRAPPVGVLGAARCVNMPFGMRPPLHAPPPPASCPPTTCAQLANAAEPTCPIAF